MVLFQRMGYCYHKIGLLTLWWYWLTFKHSDEDAMSEICLKRTVSNASSQTNSEPINSTWRNSMAQSNELDSNQYYQDEHLLFGINHEAIQVFKLLRGIVFVLDY